MATSAAAIFTVTRTNKIASKKRLLVPDRTDLNMKLQRRTALNFCRGKLQETLTVDYNATIADCGTHHDFLSMMLNEVSQYHKTTFNVVLPNRALEILADKISVQMAGGDRYAECLNLLCCQRLYSSGFQETAAQLIAEEKSGLNASSASAGSSSSSCGLSDDGR